MVEDGRLEADGRADGDDALVAAPGVAVGAGLAAGAAVLLQVGEGPGQALGIEQRGLGELLHRRGLVPVDGDEGERGVGVDGIGGRGQVAGAGGAVERALAAARPEEHPALHQVVEDAADEGLVVVAEPVQDLRPLHHLVLLHEGEHHLPERAAAIRGALREPLDAGVVGAQGHAEHVGDDLAAHALVAQLGHQVEEDLVGDVGQGGADPRGGGEVGDQHRGLADHRVDQVGGVHGPSESDAPD
ncbi:MAG: hypothetical protein KC549_00030 [Myxococcales bacterium]|nr:hypothetical protein [Myxococcales bacterium]